MCDYNLEQLVSRAANVGDKLATTSFGQVAHGRLLRNGRAECGRLPPARTPMIF
jgi:hypothetical protein